MAVLDHHDSSIGIENCSQNRCAAMFCLTWVGFFVLIGLFTWVVDAL